MSKPNTNYAAEDGILLRGYQKKLKTMKKKYFILYEESTSSCARLEYFDNEKKFRSGSTPKRVIKLKNCFNINRRLDTKHEYVIALSTKDGGFGIVLESEAEMLKWLEVLITLQRIDETCDQSRQHYEHVWQVVVQRRGLAEEKGIIGNYHACLTPKSLTFIRIGFEKPSEHRIERIEFLLTTIRRCGDSQCYFYMEVGRQSSIGPGELWMETEDALIAQNMHTMILSAMSSKNDGNLEPMRKRSSSANEATKPISMLLRKQIHAENKPTSSSFYSGLLYGRERCDSLPSTRNRTLSDGSNHNIVNSSRTVVTQGPRNQPLHTRHGNSPPFGTGNGCSESEESSLSIDEQEDSGLQIPFRFHSRSSDGVIPEENSDDIFSVENKCIDNVDGNQLSNSIDTKCPTSNIKTVSENKKTNSFLSDIIHLPKHIRSICSEYSGRSSKLSENKEQSYILMGPPSESNLSQTFNKDTAELDSFSSLCLVNRGTAVNNINFLEYTSDTNSLTEGDITSTVDRPTRAYSIGSRLEHNRLKMRLCTPSDFDQTTSRVRAFSVGSRAKIPRCDLQRSLLNYKSAVEQNSIDSSNIIKNLAESSTNYQFLGLNSSREKKSTSAPLLIHKSQNSVDRMGDLMEIDFSKSPTNVSYKSNTSPSARIYPFSMSVPVTNHDQIESYKTLLSNSHLKTSGSVGMKTGSTISKKTTTDNGYLEMKPVSISSNHNSVCMANKYVTNSNFNKHNECLSVSPKTATNHMSPEINDNSDLKFKCNSYSTKTSQTNKVIQAEKNEKDNSNNWNDPTCTYIEENIKTSSTDDTDFNEFALEFIEEDPIINTKIFIKNNTSLLKEHVEPNNNKSISNYVNLEYQKDIETATTNSHTKSLKTDCINQSCPLDETKIEEKDIEEKKANNDCPHNTYLRNLSYDIKKPSLNDFTKEVQKNDFGYEILQIKSESSLQSNKIIQRPTSIRLEKQSAHSILHRPSSANSEKISASSSVTCTCSSSALCTKINNSNSIYRPLSISDSLYCIGSKRIENTSSTKKAKVLSRPPSVSSERELNYASLDLPQCSSEKNKTVTNATKGVGYGEPKLNNSQSTFSYAKINFENDFSNNSESKH